MNIYNNSTITIYFGDSSDQLFMSDSSYEKFQHAPNLLTLQPFSKLANIMPIKKILFPRQVHGTSGFLVDATNIVSVQPFSIHGDYLITNTAGIGIGVLTADCLPILMHDTTHHAIAAIHAGWRGSVAEIAIKVLEHMHAAFGTQSTDLQVFFGPSAGPCCYAVGPEVVNAVSPYQDQVLKQRNTEIFFDLVKYNQLLLQSAGVPCSSFC